VHVLQNFSRGSVGPQGLKPSRSRRCDAFEPKIQHKHSPGTLLQRHSSTATCRTKTNQQAVAGMFRGVLSRATPWP
jgi:hypothetical protein